MAKEKQIKFYVMVFWLYTDESSQPENWIHLWAPILCAGAPTPTKNHRPNCRIRRCFWLCAIVSYVAGPQQMGVPLPRKHAYAPSPSHPLIKFTFHCCSLDGGRPVAHLVAFVGFRLSVALIFAFGSRRSLLLGPISIAIPSASPNPNSNPPKFGSCVD